MKILIAGNPNYGLAEGLAYIFPDATFLSRSASGHDLTDRNTQREVAQKSLDYDVFISVSTLWKHEQTNLVQEVAKAWAENSHRAYMIVLGSTADTPVKGTTWSYPAEKKGLRAYCRQLSLGCTGKESPNIKVTYLSPGNLHTPKQDEKLPDTLKLDVDYVAGVINWLITQPFDVNISELCLDRKENSV